jgi:16S rRNA G966 N2-methylase RsmD
MWRYRAIFSWSVIDREIRKQSEKGKGPFRIGSGRPAKDGTPQLILERTSVWDFKNRGDWAVHSDDYRGNWAPQIPRNLILRYTPEEGSVVDAFVGGGTTLIEAYLLKRKSLGIDLNPQAVKLTSHKIRQLESRIRTPVLSHKFRPKIVQGDAERVLRRMDRFGFLQGSVDLACLHPPYMNSIRYSHKKADLSNMNNVEKYCEKMKSIARLICSLLRKGGVCAILIGDIRRRAQLLPLGFRVMEAFTSEGFTIADIIIKTQHHDKSSEFYSRKLVNHFLLQHEYLLILKK